MTDRAPTIGYEHGRPARRAVLRHVAPRDGVTSRPRAPADDGARQARGPSLDDLRSLVQTRLGALVPSAEVRPRRVHSAIRYSLLAPGKRLRPILCILAAQGAGRVDGVAVDVGCAIEMVHTASLVLDDLPAMDDAQTRRGQACAHRQFDESTAILSAITLMNRAFGLLSTVPGLDDPTRTRLVAGLSSVIGSAGLVAGQESDLHDSSDFADVSDVEALNRLKTGVLFVAAAEFGGVVGGLPDHDVACLRRFAESFGIAFQTADDILDAHGTPTAAGKDVRQDGGKPTVVSLAGLDGARERVRAQLGEARRSLAACRRLDAGPLLALLDRFSRKVACEG